MGFAAGIRVTARGLAWNVIGVEHLGGQQLLRLRCDEGDLRGLEWQILHPNEKVEIIRSGFRPDAAGPLNAWRLYHTACLLEQVLGPAALLAAEPGRVQIEPYQLVPLMRALELPRPRLLLADGVGLGKTIQASLIAIELIARRRAHRVLVISPAGPLLLQWEQELRQRFGLRFTSITDSGTLQQERRKIELGGNPFNAIALCLISLDFAKQERVLEDLERASWDLAIIDEAHHCISAGTTADREDTLRRRLAEVVAQRSDGLLLLTATPHDGYDPHFASLIELLDPSLVDGRGGLIGLAYRRHVVRRLKSHIRDPATGAPMFRARRVIPVRVDVGDADAEPVRVFHRALAALVAPRLQRAVRTGHTADALAFVSLLKRSVSTIAACIKTLLVVAERYSQLGTGDASAAALRKERARALRAYRRRALRFGVLDTADEDAVAQLEADDMADDLHSFGVDDLAAELTSRTPSRFLPSDDTVTALGELIGLGFAAEPHDPKLKAIVREVRQIRVAHPAANILIYTEYADSQRAALQALRDAPGIDGVVLTVSGLDTERDRTRAVERCAEEDNVILISTDSLAEGLNLQQRCNHLIHLDLPYNPNRLEQRNGRIDRYGQPRDPEIRYLYLAATFEERLLLRLIAKYEKARERLAVMPETLAVTAEDDALGKGLMAGFAEEQAQLFAEEAPAVRTLDQVGEDTNAAAYRDLVHEIDRAFEGYERIAARHGWMADRGLNADAAQMAEAEAGRRRGDASLGRIDLLEFVADAVGAETGCNPVTENRMRLPVDWTAGLDGLPGFDAVNASIRLTRRRSQTRDSHGRAVGFLGRAHPLVRRAIGRVRRSEYIAQGERLDVRVSAVQADAGVPLSLLYSFCVELHSARHVALQCLIAVLLPVQAPPRAVADPAHWLALAAKDRAIPTAGLWRRLYAGWAPQRQSEVETVATGAMQRVTADFIATRTAQADREGAELNRWARARAIEICGPERVQSADLFDAPPTGPRWQTLSAPIDRLAAFAMDSENPPARRREANSVVELFRRRDKECAERHDLAVPILRPVDLLMLVPRDGA